MLSIIVGSIYFLICLFVLVALYFINYHIKKFGIDSELDNKITRAINISTAVLIIISFILFILVPWKSIVIRLL